jgi:hypothetical protein
VLVPWLRVWIPVDEAERPGVANVPVVPNVGDTIRVELDSGQLVIGIVEHIAHAGGAGGEYDALVFCRPASPSPTR